VVWSYTHARENIMLQFTLYYCNVTDNMKRKKKSRKGNKARSKENKKEN